MARIFFHFGLLVFVSFCLLSESSEVLKIQEAYDGFHMATINVSISVAQPNSSTVETIIIFDKSGSMSEAVPRMIKQVMPLFFSKLSYDKNQTVHFIPFDSYAELKNLTVGEFETSPLVSGGGTRISTAIVKCREVFESLDGTKPVRVLTISDGMVEDPQETETQTEKLVKFLKTSNFRINSQAVRLFTSEQQPDTKALASILRISSSQTNLTDIEQSKTVEFIAETMAQLFRDDKLARNKILTASGKIFVQNGWQSGTADSKIVLSEGENLFWINLNNTSGKKLRPKRDIPGSIMLDGKTVDIKDDMPLTITSFQRETKKRFAYLISHMRNLKVVGTTESEKSVTEIVEFYTIMENLMISKSKVSELHKPSLSNAIKIVADEKLENLSPEEAKLYLDRPLPELEEFYVEDDEANSGIRQFVSVTMVLAAAAIVGLL